MHSLEEARVVANEKLEFPIIVRPSFTLGGTGGGIAADMDELMLIAEGGLKASLTTEVLLEESVFGWKEFEMEVMRDKNDNTVIICAIENMDPMGIHTGDSITVAPAQTLTDREYQIMRDASLKVLRMVGVETGGSNVQFCIHPQTGRLAVIEMNPRVSRSSALASKATGFPLLSWQPNWPRATHLTNFQTILPAKLQHVLSLRLTMSSPNFRASRLKNSLPRITASG